jgi:bacterioferritin
MRILAASIKQYAMAEHVREILIDEQEHQIDLLTALGEDARSLAKQGTKKGHTT